MKTIIIFFRRMKGGEAVAPIHPFSNIAWSWLGGFLGIYFVSLLNQFLFSDMVTHLFLVGSFGASAVLIYGAPQAEFSQPRNLVGGHVISAFVGMTMYKYLSLDIALLGSLAVSVSIVAMHLTRTIHPPGGATALIAVIGSAQVHELGYLYIALPIASGALILLVIALIVNNLSTDPKRHYPRWWF